MAANQEVYLNECIIKQLIPFINEHHRDDNYVFWPDLASSHYAKSVTDWLKQNNIPFVPKAMNPANVPEDLTTSLLPMLQDPIFILFTMIFVYE